MSKLVHPALWLLAGSVVACSFDTTGINGDRDGANPVIDAAVFDGASPVIDADPGPDQDSCVDECLTGTVLHDCDTGEDVTCDLGCYDSGTPHCGQLVPSNGASANQLSGVSQGLHIGADAKADIDSDDGTIEIDGDTIREAGVGVGPSGIGYFTLDDSRIAVLAVADFTMADGSYLEIHGARGLIILSDGEVVIEGFIDIAGGCPDDLANVSCAGPGGGQGAVFEVHAAGGCGPGGDGWGGSGVPDAGGGGGALGKNGAKGGDASDASLGGSAGLASGCPGATAVPLRGGSGGGTGHESGTGAGGGGGGALQITSLTSISILGSGAAIWAGGAGGGGTEDTHGGGGGGAGGAILLEAPAITLQDGGLAANGGGGGSGNGGSAGEYGLLETAAAQGGANPGSDTSGDGGAGGARYADAQPGDGPIDGAGGGGGGGGIIRFNVPAAELTVDSVIISPEESRGDLVVE